MRGWRLVVNVRCFWLLVAALLVGCEPLHQSYMFLEPRQTTLPVAVPQDSVWITSIPTGADVYIQPYEPDELPTHSTVPDAYKGKTPLLLPLPPGRYWVEVVLDAEVFAQYFSPPYENVQFEPDGAASEALLFKPFAPGERRRVLRYYRLDKGVGAGQTVIALFHPLGVPTERVASFYPREAQFQIAPEALPDAFPQDEVPYETQGLLLDLLQRGGKVVWSKGSDYRIALEVQYDGIEERISTLFTGAPLPDPLIPDGGPL
jgi:hypothetical protein